MVDVSIYSVEENDTVSDEDNMVCCEQDMSVFSGGLQCGECASFLLLAPSGLITGMQLNR